MHGFYNALIIAEIIILFNIYSYTVHENSGTIENAIKVQKRDDSPPTEVNISISVEIRNITAIAGTGIYIILLWADALEIIDILILTSL